jgi:hypothetical protein
MTGLRWLPLVAGVSIVAPRVAHAQSASTPIMDPHPSIPVPTIGGDGPHTLDGRLLVGVAAGIGESGAETTGGVRSFSGFDAWLGYGLGDRLAVLGFGQAVNPAGDLRYALGGGVRVWPFPKGRGGALEGRVGIDRITHDRLPSNIGAIVEAVVAFDLVRLPTVGLELRTTIAGAWVGGQRYAEFLFGVGVSVY